MSAAGAGTSEDLGGLDVVGASLPKGKNFVAEVKPITISAASLMEVEIVDLSDLRVFEASHWLGQIDREMALMTFLQFEHGSPHFFAVIVPFGIGCSSLMRSSWSLSADSRNSRSDFSRLSIAFTE